MRVWNALLRKRVAPTHMRIRTCVLAVFAIVALMTAAHAEHPQIVQRSTPAPDVSAAAINPTIENDSISFRELGARSGIQLRGAKAGGGVNLGLRRDLLARSADMQLSVAFSPALAPGLSQLRVLVNDQLVGTITPAAEEPGKPQTVRIPVDASYFADYNHISFQFNGSYAAACDTAGGDGLWAIIGNDSTVNLGLLRLPLADDLGLLPEPFFDQRDIRVVSVPFVLVNPEDHDELRAAGSVAAWIGSLAGFRGNQFQVLVDQPPGRSAIVFATNARKPKFLDLQDVNAPTLSMRSLPGDPTVKLLVVQGRDGAQLRKAADALALGGASLTGKQATVGTVEYPALSQPYDAPRWLSTRHVVSFSELIPDPKELRVQGIDLNNQITVGVRAAPDLYTWNDRSVPIVVRYRYTPNAVSGSGSLSLFVGDRFIRSVALASSKIADGTTNLLSRALGSSTVADARFNVPGELLRGERQLNFVVQIPSEGDDRCGRSNATSLTASIDPESVIDLRGFHHFIAMPDLAAYAASGFPFSRYADLHRTAVVLSTHPTIPEIETYLTAIARISAATGLPGIRFELLSPSEVVKAGDRDILLITQGDEDRLLQRWKHPLPAIVMAGERTVAATMQPLKSLGRPVHYGWPSAEAATGSTQLHSKGSIGAIIGFESPLHADSSVVALTASDGAGMSMVGASIGGAREIGDIRGDLVLLRDGRAQSYRVGPVYELGDLPWWQLLWLRLAPYRLLVAFLGIVACVLLAAAAAALLRLRAGREQA